MTSTTQLISSAIGRHFARRNVSSKNSLKLQPSHSDKRYGEARKSNPLLNVSLKTI